MIIYDYFFLFPYLLLTSAVSSFQCFVSNVSRRDLLAAAPAAVAPVMPAPAQAAQAAQARPQRLAN